ncbi:MAG: hypothetical protein JJE28_07060 [Actinomycetales bacterium]|nr:hypothetical protein [Actinomycetales bacterium]
MSQPKIGDRVRVVTEAEVREVWHDGVVLVDGRSYFEGTGNVVSIEVIPPLFVLPTKRWAIVADRDGFNFWTRNCLTYEDPKPWVAGFGEARCLSDSDIMRLPNLYIISEGIDA